MYDVITIGSATLDVFLCCQSLIPEEVNGKKEICFPYGSKIDVDSALFETGGGGTNTATTFVRQGFKTAILAKVGNDFPGEKVLQKLGQEGIDTSLIVKDQNDSTDFSTIVWAPKKGSVILVNRGKGKIEASEIPWDRLQTKWFHISSVEGNLDMVDKVVEACSKSAQGAKISWNPGKRELEQKEKLLSLLPHIELLILNKKEAEKLVGEDNSPSESQEAISNTLLFALQNLPVKNKLITDGHHGAYFFNGNGWIWSDVFKVEREEATGAGDAFGSGFVAGLLKGFTSEQCLKFASANAASVVTAASAKQGILRSDQVDEWIKKDLEIKAI